VIAEANSERSRRPALQASRFAAVGVLNTLVDYVLFVGITKVFHLPLDSVWMARLVSATAAMTLSFFLNRRWVFEAQGQAPVHHQAARFFAATAIGVYGIGVTVTQLFANAYQGPGRWLYAVLRDVGLTGVASSVFTEALATKTAAFGIATLCTMTFNFLAYRYWVFRARPTQTL
jgi:putative flippase GtrA